MSENPSISQFYGKSEQSSLFFFFHPSPPCRPQTFNACAVALSPCPMRSAAAYSGTCPQNKFPSVRVLRQQMQNSDGKVGEKMSTMVKNDVNFISSEDERRKPSSCPILGKKRSLLHQSSELLTDVNISKVLSHSLLRLSKYTGERNLGITVLQITVLQFFFLNLEGGI